MSSFFNKIKESDFDSILNKGIKISQLKRNEEAVEYLNKATEMENSRGEAFVILGGLYEELGQVEKAILTYKKGIKTHPTFIDNYFDLAVLYSRQIPEIRKNLMEYPIGYLGETMENTQEYFLKAAYLGDSESINILNEKEIKAFSKNECISELIKIADKRLERKNYEGVVSIYSFIVQNENEDAMKILAGCYFNIGQVNDQDEKYKIAYENYSEAYRFASRLYKRDSNSIERKELLGMIFLVIGNLYGSIYNHAKAIKFLEKAKSLLGNKDDLLKNLGQEYYFNEQIEEAKKYLSEYASLNNTSDTILIKETKSLKYYKYLGKVNLLAGNSGHKQEEFDYLKKAIDLFPNKQEAYYYLGVCYEDNGDNKLATEAYLKGLEVAPNGGYTSIIRDILKNK